MPLDHFWAAKRQTTIRVDDHELIIIDAVWPARVLGI